MFNAIFMPPFNIMKVFSQFPWKYGIYSTPEFLEHFDSKLEGKPEAQPRYQTQEDLPGGVSDKERIVNSTADESGSCFLRSKE